jgi:hypothetical protein
MSGPNPTDESRRDSNQQAMYRPIRMSADGSTASHVVHRLVETGDRSVGSRLTPDFVDQTTDEVEAPDRDEMVVSMRRAI